MENQQEGISQNKDIILATTSPYRLEIFKKLGLHFVGEGSNVDEYATERPTNPEELTKHLARLKAESVAQNHKTGIVIGFDSVGYFDGKILEKPTSREEGFARLQAMAGNTFSFYSGVHMIDITTGKTLSRCVQTDNTMRKYSDSEINKYLDNCDEKYKTHAHGFDPSNYYSMTFIDTIVGNPMNVMMGIPLSAIMEMLKELGYTI
ncbi:MAG: Maf family protein [Candidatus Absconditabacterales bacterium]